MWGEWEIKRCKKKCKVGDMQEFMHGGSGGRGRRYKKMKTDSSRQTIKFKVLLTENMLENKR